MIELWRGNERVATAEKVDLQEELRAPDIYPGKLYCFYFTRLTLEPVKAFEHIAGAALIGILDRCSLHGHDQDTHGLRYVHGKSEVMKGKPSTTAVLLVAHQLPISDPEWLQMLPEIWHRFQHIRADRHI